MTDTGTVSSGKARKQQKDPTYAEVLHAKAQDGKPAVLRFKGGLFLWVTPNGTKSWRCRFQPKGGKETTHVLGRFPEMSIRDAQAAREAIRQTVRKGGNPKAEMQALVEARQEAEGNTLRTVAARWAERAAIKTEWTKAFDAGMKSRLERFVFPKLGNLPVAQITMDQVEALIFDIHTKPKHRGRVGMPATAACIRQYLGRIFDYALRHKLVPFNPVAQVATDLPTHNASKRRHQPHVRGIEQAREVLAAVEARRGTPPHYWRAASPYSLLCHRFIALTGVRKLEALEATWDELDLDRGLWTIPAARMKGKAAAKADEDRNHVVALSPQALEVIAAARRIRRNGLVFPSPYAGKAKGNRSTLNELMTVALKDAGLGPVHTLHGWRHTFATVMAEANFRDRPVIDGMLAHKPIGASHVAHVYDHSELIEDRRRVASAWADMLLVGAPTALALIGLEPVELEPAAPGSNVVQLPRRAA